MDGGVWAGRVRVDGSVWVCVCGCFVGVGGCVWGVNSRDGRKKGMRVNDHMNAMTNKRGSIQIVGERSRVND